MPTFFRRALNRITTKISHFTSFFSLFFLNFYIYFLTFHCCLSVVLWPKEKDFPEDLHPVVHVIIDKGSFESLMCLDLIYIYPFLTWQTVKVSLCRAQGQGPLRALIHWVGALEFMSLFVKGLNYFLSGTCRQYVTPRVKRYWQTLRPVVHHTPYANSFYFI